MAYWMTSAQIAEKYEITEQEIFSWAELKEISSAYIKDTLMIDDDSVQFYLGTHKMLAEKQAIRERLIKEEDKIIHQELEKYDEAALLIRLQSECFPLYKLLIKVLADLIPNNQDRKLFCAIIQGKSLKHIPKYHKMSDSDAFKVYIEIVQELYTNVKCIFKLQRLTNKSLDKILKDEKERISIKKENISLQEEIFNWKMKYKKLSIELDGKYKEKKEWILSNKKLNEKNLELQKLILQIKETLQHADSQDSTEERKAVVEAPLTLPSKEEKDVSSHLTVAERIMDFLRRKR